MAPQMELRPATPRHDPPRQPGASVAEPAAAADPEAEARAAMMVTAIGRVQLTLDILLRRVERIDDRIAVIESQLTGGAPGAHTGV